MERYFEVRDTPNKGLGAFATVDIPRGTRLLLEEPLLVAISFSDSESLTEATFKAYQAMSLPRREAYDHLYYTPRLYDIYLAHVQQSSTGLSEAMMDCVARVAATRALNSYGDAVYELASRFNHSCTPNCNQDEAALGMIAIYSVCDIKAGEQLTVSYTGSDQPHEERQRHLDHYGFVCDCSACNLNTAQGRLSEERRLEIWRLRQDLSFLQGLAGMQNNKVSGPLAPSVSKSTGEPDPETAITTAVSLYKAEDLVGIAMIDWYYVGFFYYIYRPMGFYDPDKPNDDKDRGIRWARKAIEADFRGQDSASYRLSGYELSSIGSKATSWWPENRAKINDIDLGMTNNVRIPKELRMLFSVKGSLA
ncbi:SET domain containing protein [Venturia nashicola]|uniref:SET domain containing protein n=1 Tax=Venturia nashicola TaxID=86259 RepID=A0A4Z1P3T1_9PEZI|nr:SET domain containing protein [Venturia nashicola]